MKHPTDQIHYGSSAPKNRPDHLADFVERLVKEKKLPFSDDTFFRSHHRQMVDHLHDVLRTKLISRLSQTQKEKFHEMLTHGADDRKLQKFVLSHIPDNLSYLTHVLLHFRLYYLAKPHRHFHHNHNHGRHA